MTLALATDDDPPSPVHTTVPPVLHRIVASSVKSTSDFRPTLTHLAHQAFNQLTLIWRNGLVIQARFQILVKAFPALLGRARPDYMGNPHPIVGSLVLYQMQKVRVFALRPRTPLMRTHRESLSLVE